MGEVFLAYDDRLDRRIAIKRIRPDAGTRPERRERFRREARMAARLSHPAIVQVHDILQENDVDSIVMEYVEGSTLRQAVEEGPLPFVRVLELARELADGLDAAHRQGIVHRDLKTENVLIALSGRPKITDFGIAKRLLAEEMEEAEESEESLTADGAVVGTCRSMSPEQARGEPVDHRTDLFALGVLLYEALTGHSPFEAENRLATLSRVLVHRQVPVREVVPAVPAELSSLVDRLLEKDPGLRPASAAQVRKTLDRLALASMSGQSLLEKTLQTDLDLPTTVAGTIGEAGALPPSGGAVLARPGLRRRAVWLLAFALLAAALAASAYMALRRPRPPLYVAVLAPEIGTGAGDGEVELLASGVRVALLQGLASLERVSPQAFEEVDAASGSLPQIAKAVAADELVGTRLDCRTEVCRISLTRRRGSDGSVSWADSFDVPADDSSVVAGIVRRRIEQGYTGFALRNGAPDPQVSREDQDELLRLRRKLKARQEPEASILAGLEAIRKRSPGFLDAYLLEARVLRQRFWASRRNEDFAQAFGLIQEARRLAPDDPGALFELADLTLGAGKQDLAEKALAELAPLVPGDARLLERQAQLLSVQGHGDAALERMRAAARLQPSSRRLHNLAQMELKMGQAAAARHTLALLLGRSPRDYRGLSLLAQVELSSGDLQSAAQLYSELVHISPGLAELSNLGTVYLIQGRYADAAEAFRRAFEMQPNYPVIALNLADAELLVGKKAQAEAHYRLVLELIARDPSPTDPQFLTVKAQALAHLGSNREAVEALQEALRHATDQGAVASEAAIVYALVGEESSALVSVEKAIQQGTGAHWFSLPWFASLRKLPYFQQLLRQARPGL